MDAVWPLLAESRRRLLTATPDEAVAAANTLLSVPVDDDDDDDDDRPSPKRARVASRVVAFEELILNDILKAALEAVDYQSDHVVSFLSFLLVNKTSFQTVTSNPSIIAKLEEIWLPRLRRKAMGHDLHRFFDEGLLGRIAQPLRRRNTTSDASRSLRFSVVDRFAIGLDVLRHVARTGDSSVLMIALRQWLLPTPYLMLSRRLFDLFDNHEDERERFENEGYPFNEYVLLMKRAFSDEITQIVDSFAPALFAELCSLLNNLIREYNLVREHAFIIPVPRGRGYYYSQTLFDRSTNRSIRLDDVDKKVRKYFDQWASIIYHVLVGKLLRSSIDPVTFAPSDYSSLRGLVVNERSHLIQHWRHAVTRARNKDNSAVFVLAVSDKDLAASAPLRALVETFERPFTERIDTAFMHWNRVTETITQIIGPDAGLYQGYFVTHPKHAKTGSEILKAYLAEYRQRFIFTKREDLVLHNAQYDGEFALMRQIFKHLFTEVKQGYWCGRLPGQDSASGPMEVCWSISVIIKRLCYLESRLPMQGRQTATRYLYEDVVAIERGTLAYMTYHHLSRLDATDDKAVKLFVGKNHSLPVAHYPAAISEKQWRLAKIRSFDCQRFVSLFKAWWPGQHPNVEDVLLDDGIIHSDIPRVKAYVYTYLTASWFDVAVGQVFLHGDDTFWMPGNDYTRPTRLPQTVAHYFLGTEPTSAIDPDDMFARAHRLVCARMTHSVLSGAGEGLPVSTVLNNPATYRDALAAWRAETAKPWLVVNVALTAPSTTAFRHFIEVLSAPTRVVERFMTPQLATAILAHLQRYWQDALDVYEIGFPPNKPYLLRAPTIMEMAATRDKHLDIVKNNLTVLLELLGDESSL